MDQTPPSKSSKFWAAVKEALIFGSLILALLGFFIAAALIALSVDLACEYRQLLCNWTDYPSSK